MERTLSFEQANTLVCYILGTTRQRQDTVEVWRELSKEKNEDGTVKFPNAESNAEYYEELEIRLQDIIKVLEGR